MSILLMGLALAQTNVLPQIDRRALDLQARAEALQSRGRPVARPVSRRTQPVAQRADQRRGSAQPVARRVSASSDLDLSSITTICRAAGNQADPSAFLSTLSRAYSLSAPQSSSLRTSCAAYLAGRADARVGGYQVAPH